VEIISGRKKFKGSANEDSAGHWEHVIVSHISAVIPESVKQSWNDWRTAMKKTEKEITGGEHINEGAEMAGWGVEEADERNKSHASMLPS
jgi:hypothetical protein